jgi:hypothetical protein
MKFLRILKARADERNDLIQLKHELDALYRRHQQETASLKSDTDEFRNAVFNYACEAGIIIAEIADIETHAMLRRCTYWRVPVPSRPYGDDNEHPYWEWHSEHGRYYLSDVGLKELRRGIHEEWEMWSKPWLSLTAIAISVFSLAVSLLRS